MLKKHLDGILAALERGKPSERLRDGVIYFLDTCNARAEEGWKRYVMSDSKDRIVELLDQGEDIRDELELHLRWVRPVEPDPEVVARVKARDRAQTNGD